MEKLSSTKLAPGAKKAEDLGPENLTGVGGSIFKKTHLVSLKSLQVLANYLPEALVPCLINHEVSLRVSMAW